MEYEFKTSLIALKFFCDLLTGMNIFKICFSQTVNKATDRVQF